MTSSPAPRLLRALARRAARPAADLVHAPGGPLACPSTARCAPRRRTSSSSASIPRWPPRSRLQPMRRFAVRRRHRLRRHPAAAPGARASRSGSRPARDRGSGRLPDTGGAGGEASARVAGTARAGRRNHAPGAGGARAGAGADRLRRARPGRWRPTCCEGRGGDRAERAGHGGARARASSTALIDILVEATARYLAMQVAAGAQALQLFESWAELLPENVFERLVTRPHRRIVDRLRADGHRRPRSSAFPAAAAPWSKAMREAAGVQAVGLDVQAPAAMGRRLQEQRDDPGRARSHPAARRRRGAGRPGRPAARAVVGRPLDLQPRPWRAAGHPGRAHRPGGGAGDAGREPHRRVLFNLGGPDGPAAVRPFLRNLFSDPAIIGAPALVRLPLAALISRTRATIGQGQLRHHGRRLADPGGDAGPGGRPGGRARRRAAGRRDPGLHRHALLASPRRRDGARPCATSRPTRSCWRRSIRSIPPPRPPRRSRSGARAIRRSSAQRSAAGTATPGLIEAHAAPHPGDLGRGRRAAGAADVLRPRPAQAHRPTRAIPTAGRSSSTCAAIAARLGPGWDWTLSFQSRVGPLEWIGPSTSEAIEQAARDGVGVLIDPVAFVSEHVETLVELDHDYAELAREPGPHALSAGAGGGGGGRLHRGPRRRGRARARPERARVRTASLARPRPCRRGAERAS